MDRAADASDEKAFVGARSSAPGTPVESAGRAAARPYTSRTIASNAS